MDYARLDSLIASETYRNSLIADLRTLIAFPTVKGEPAEGAPFGEVTLNCLNTALDIGRREGFTTHNYDGFCGDIRMAGKDGDIGILSHLDIVPVGDGWTKDPYAGTIEDGKIFGRGVMDDKGPAVAALYAMKAVKEAGYTMKNGVRLILGCDEETGMTDMAHYRKVADSLPLFGFSPDADYPVINIEKGGLNMRLEAACSGEDNAELPVYSLNAGIYCNVVPGTATAVLGTSGIGYAALADKVTAFASETGFTLSLEDLGEGKAQLTAVGVQAHASVPHLGKNAAGMLLITLDAIGAGGGCRSAIHGMAALTGLEMYGESLGIAQEDAESGKLTCNLGILRFDGSMLTCDLDIRYPLCTDETASIQAMTAAAAAQGITCRYLHSHAPHHVPADSAIVQGLLRAYHDVTGNEAYAYAIGGGTYSRCMPNTVAFGINFPGDEDVCHMPDEFIDIEKLMLSVRIMAHAIVELGAEKEAL